MEDIKLKMVSSTNNLLIDITVCSTKFWLWLIPSLFLMYIFVRKFNKLAKKKVSKIGNYELVKTWIWLLVMAIKAVMKDHAAMFAFIQKCCSEFKDTPTDLFIGFHHSVYIDKPEDIEIVLNNSNALQKSNVYKFFKKYLDGGLLLVSVDKWKRRRRLAAPFFTSKYVDKNYKALNSHTLDFVKKLRVYSDNDEYFDLTESVSKVTLSMIWEITFNKDVEFTEKEMEFTMNSVDKVSEIYGIRIYRPWLYPNSIFNWCVTITSWSKYFKSLDYCIKKMSENKKRKVQEILQQIKEQDEDSVTLSYMEYIIRLNAEENGISDEDVAGYETSAMTICLAILMLAMNPEIQEKLYKEIKKYSGEDDEDLNSQKIHEMIYLDQCVKETLRLFPPAPFIMRKATNSFQLNECRIQKNSNLIIPILMVHRNPDTYPNPLQWNPDNFAPDRVASRHKYCFLPFSGGPRGCIGKKYAMAAIKVTLIKFLKAYRVETDQTIDDIKLKLEFFLRNGSRNKIKLYSRVTH